MIKLPNGSEMFWLSNKCFYPRKDTASIYLKEEYIYLVRKRTKTAVSFEDYGDKIDDLMSFISSVLSEDKVESRTDEITLDDFVSAEE